MAACRTRDAKKAAFYLDLRRIPADERLDEALQLACDAKAVFDRLLPTNLAGLSTQPSGDLDDNQPRNIDHLVTATTADGPVSLYLERYEDKAGLARWRLDARSVDKIPLLYTQFGVESWERHIPAVAVENTLLDIKLWQWGALIALTLLVLTLSRFAGRLLQSLLTRVMNRWEHLHLLGAAVARAAVPVRTLLALALFKIGTMPMDFSLGVRQRLLVFEGAILVIGVTWFLVNLGDAAVELARLRWSSRDKIGAVALLPLVQRIGNAILIIIAALIMLQIFGVNVTAVLAGLGVGGLAVALAAQKTVENFFGGMMIAIDQPVRVGDTCRFGAQTGTVEDIGLRSTRLRTASRTLVTIPNGEFSQLQIENISKRDKISFTAVLGIDCLTPAAKVRELLVAIRTFLAADSRVDQQTLEVNMLNLGGQSIDIEILGFIQTTNFRTFKAIREELYLILMEMIEARGLAFGLPSSYAFGRMLPPPIAKQPN
jgi:MscS family membrane protein